MDSNKRNDGSSILAHLQRDLSNRGLLVVSQTELARLEQQAATLPARRVLPVSK